MVLGSLPRESAPIRWVPVSLDLFQGFPVTQHVSKMTYARLLIPRVFPESVRKILYLDVDIIVLNGINALWETDIDGYVVGAVSDTISPLLEKGYPSAAGLPHVQDYFNAGILLIDLNRWRNEHVSEKAFDYLAQHPQTPYWDQDALNLACDGLWKKLDPRWNFQSHFGTNIAEMNPEQRPWIVHFISSTKPWDPRSRSVNARLYDNFRSRTCFARTPRAKMVDSLRSFWSGVQNVWKRRGFSSASRAGKRIRNRSRRPI
jgi:lipopolysaccharide biosynthesis glycosyltransferase